MTGRPWNEDVVYMILIDRFHRGSRSRGAPEAPFHGGDLAGVLEKLDYLQDLGATALWLSPVCKNQKDGYHGYWPVDFFDVDPRFGTLEEFAALVAECHRRGMKVLLDMVFNHTGYDHPMPRDPRYRGWFHKGKEMLWMDQRSMEECSLHGLPDFAHEKPEVARYLIDMALWWVEKTGVDGFRLDAVKHVPIGFWRQLSDELHRKAGPDFLLLGEVFRGVPAYLARYQREGGVDAVFDVPFADTVRSALSRDAEMPGQGLFERLLELKREYKTMLFNEILRKLFARRPTDMRWFHRLLHGEDAYARPDRLAPFIDNHDLSRFASEAQDPGQRLRMALTLLLTWRGIPVLTYGTECGMRGRTDGSNRSPMPFGADPDLADFTRRLITFRRSQPALTRGTLLQVHADRETFAFLRQAGGSKVLVVLNNSGTFQHRDIDIPSGAGFGPWKDVFGGETLRAGEGILEMGMPARSARVFVPS